MYITILITTYNAENYIIDTLNSIMDQTYKLYEILIIDDGSTDNTKEIVANYSHSHQLDNIRVISLPHIGRVGALNHGVQAAQYNWIAILDADDLWHTQKLAIQVAYINKFQLKCVATECILFENDNKIDTHQITIGEPSLLKLREITLNKMLSYNIISHSSILMSKELAKYDETVNQEDWDLWLNLLHKGVKIHLIKLNLCYHRIHSLQSFEAKNHFQYVLRSCGLQLKYCVRTGKLLHVFYVIFRVFYHMILNRKMRLLLIKLKNGQLPHQLRQ